MTGRLLTGATGFVGGAIALELLDRTDEPLVAVVRARDDGHARQRLHGALAEMAVGYGRDHLLDAIRTRTTAVAGDVTAPLCGVDPAGLPAVAEVWHCAASLRFEERHRAEIMAHNVAGTEHLLALAAAAGAGTVNHVSTAYVAGPRRGPVAEEPATDPAATNNCYEESKVRAEALVAASELRTRILRPGIVIGHSVTRHGVNWSGLYGMARHVHRFRTLGGRATRAFLPHVQLRVVGEPETRLNLVPVDVVARNAVGIALSGSPETYFHLTSPAAPTLGEVATELLGLLGLRQPLWVDDRATLTPLDQEFDRGTDFYRSYLRDDKQFGTAHTEAACGPDLATAPMDAGEVRAYLRHYLEEREPAAV
jgi:thioester reductase-like protein